MVAITVILAAVIGAFVLEIGDQQETAPSTSFDSEENTRAYITDSSNPPTTWRRVEIAHAGGETIDFTQMAVKVQGNESVYSAVQGNGQTLIEPAVPLQNPFVTANGIECRPGESCEWTSGQTIAPMFYGEVSYERAYSDATGSPDRAACWCGTATVNLTSVRYNCGSGCGHTLPNLQQGDNTNIVWTAQSGGKTQNLFRYQVQGAR
jgi:hypothetical protein